jgi:hypothetical protein
VLADHADRGHAGDQRLAVGLVADDHPKDDAHVEVASRLVEALLDVAQDRALLPRLGLHGDANRGDADEERRQAERGEGDDRDTTLAPQ